MPFERRPVLSVVIADDRERHWLLVFLLPGEDRARVVFNQPMREIDLSESIDFTIWRLCPRLPDERIVIAEIHDPKTGPLLRHLEAIDEVMLGIPHVPIDHALGHGPDAVTQPELAHAGQTI